MAKWTITDYSTGSGVTWTFPVNPNSFQPPNRAANLKQQELTSPQGGLVTFQGRDRPQRMNFSGLVNTQTFYNELRTELDKYYPLEVTDDQGQSWYVIVESYQFTRLRRALNQWRYDYDVQCLVVT